MTEFLDRVVQLAWTQTWQVAAVASAAAVCSFVVGRRSIHLSYLLWMFVLVKSLTLPVWSSPTSVFGFSSGDVQPVAAGDGSTNVSATDSEVVRIETQRLGAATATLDSDASVTAATTSGGQSIRLAVIWVCGTVLAIAIIVGRYLSQCRRIFAGSSLPSNQLSARFADVSRRLGLARVPRLRLVDSAFGPAAFGVLKPVVIVPNSLVTDVDHDGIEPVLAHELVHVRRRDMLHSWLQLAAVAMWWWNPIVWIASARATRAREHCCDEEVMGTLEYAGERYAQCLIDVLRSRQRRLVGPVPLIATAGPMTKRRLEQIMRPGGRFARSMPRWQWLIAMALALFVLPAARPVESEAVPPHSELASDGGERTASTLGARDEMAPPELLYVAWHKHGIKFTGKPKGPVTVWNLQGDLLSERESANLMDQLGSCMIHWRTEGELYPLLLVFKVDDRLTRGPLSADIVTESGLRLHGGSARNVPTHGMNVSVVAPSANEFAAWPERITVEVAYPVEEVTVIKTLTEVPNEPVEIARGVTWYLDPDRAVTFSSLGTKRAVGKTSWVLQKGRDEQTRLMSYAARVYQSDDERLDTSYHTILGEPGGELQSLVVSEPFDNREQIKRVEFVRQQRRLIRFDNIPVRLQDMPQAGD